MEVLIYVFDVKVTTGKRTCTITNHAWRGYSVEFPDAKSLLVAQNGSGTGGSTGPGK